MDKTKEIVEKHTGRAKDKNKKFYDRKAKAVQISVGDTVLVKRVAFDGKHKIADKFEEEAYKVIEQPRPEIPVFKVKSESGKEKTLHRNLLFKVEEEENDEELDKDRDNQNIDASKIRDHEVMEKEVGMSEGTGFVRNTDRDGTPIFLQLIQVQMEKK